MTADKIQVLYVDDERDLLEIGKCFLENEGAFAVDTLTSAKEALTRINKVRYDTIISDYQMPEMNGIAFLKHLKAKGDATPFIIFTGKGREEVVIEALNNGADFYLQKGGEPKSQFAELSNKIRYAVSRKQSEKALRESEERYRSVVNDQTEMIARFTPEGSITFVNEAYRSYFASLLELKDVEGQNIRDILQVKNYAAVEKFLGSLSKKIPIREIERVVNGSDGNRHWQIWSVRALFGADGNPAEYQVVGRDITDITRQKNIERELQRSEQRSLAVSMNAGSWIWEVDTDGVYRYSSPAVLQILGYRPDELVGKMHFYDLYAPSVREEQKAVMFAAFGREEAFRHFVMRSCHRNGAPVVLNTSGTPVFDEDGTFSGYSGIDEDITERERAEAALRESRQILDTIINTIPVRVFWKDRNLTYLGCNTAFARDAGFEKPEDIIGKDDYAMGWSKQADLYRTDDRFVIDSGRPRLLMEEPQTTPSGELISLLTSKVPLTNATGEIIGVLGTYHDVTERKNTEAAFQAMVRSMVGTTGLDALQKITESVSSWLGAECVMVGEIQPDRQTVKVLSMLLDGKEVLNFSYTLKGTPCDNVEKKGFCLYPDNVIQLFPESRDLVELNIRGYIGTPLRNSMGEVFGILCALSRSPIQSPASLREIMDIIAVKASAEIERTQMEHTLYENQQMLTEAMDLANLVSWECDSRTGLFTFNDRFYALYGTTVEREGGNQMPAEVYVREFVHPEDRNVITEEVEKSNKTTDPHYVSQREHRIIRRDGEVRHIVVRIKVTKDAEGRTIRVHGANQDITERKRAEEALRQVNKKLSLLSSITRHDINNQVLTLNGFVGMLQGEIPDPSFDNYFSRITMASGQIAAMIRFTKEYEQLGLNEPVWQDIRKISKMAAVDLLPESVNLIVNTGEYEIFADPMFMLVLYNLFENAIRHGVHVTGITVSFIEDENSGTLVVEDNGIGIPASFKENIFEREFGANTGFGLYLGREILSITGLSIRETGTEGKCARFEIHLPPGTWRRSAG